MLLPCICVGTVPDQGGPGKRDGGQPAEHGQSCRAPDTHAHLSRLVSVCLFPCTGPRLAVVPSPRQRAVGVQRARHHDPTRRQHQRCEFGLALPSSLPSFNFLPALMTRIRMVLRWLSSGRCRSRRRNGATGGTPRPAWSSTRTTPAGMPPPGSAGQTARLKGHRPGITQRWAWVAPSACSTEQRWRAQKGLRELVILQ